MLKKVPMLTLGGDPSFRIQATVDPAFLEWGLRFRRNCTSARFSRNTRAGLVLALESRLAMHALAERHKIDFGHEVAGKMHLFYSRTAFAVARQVMALKRGQGAVQNALSPTEALAIEPALAGAAGLEGVIHSPEDEAGDLLRFASGLLEVLARDYGVETHFGFDADRLRTERGAVGITDAAGMTISGDRLADCLGVAAPHFLRKAGIRVPVWPMKGYSFTAAAGEMAPRVSVTDTARKIVFCSLAGRMRAAGLAELGGWDPSHLDQPLQALVGLARQSLPGAAAYEALESEWAGLRPMSPSSVSIISRPRLELLLNIGHGMLGSPARAFRSIAAGVSRSFPCADVRTATQYLRNAFIRSFEIIKNFASGPNSSQSHHAPCPMSPKELRTSMAADYCSRSRQTNFSTSLRCSPRF